jgi:hypothetical protein
VVTRGALLTGGLGLEVALVLVAALGGMGVLMLGGTLGLEGVFAPMAALVGMGVLMLGGIVGFEGVPGRADAFEVLGRSASGLE